MNNNVKVVKIENDSFFQSSLHNIDPELANAISKEKNREQLQIELIASENIVSKAVLEAQGSILTNKYAEGYPSKRYYGGCEYVDLVENLAIERAKKLFSCNYANVQPHSGSQANQAVFLALLKPHDTILGMSLNDGGHLTHGAAPNLSGKWFNAVHYGVDAVTHLIDYNQVWELAKKHQPKLIIAGGSAYSRQIDFAKFSEIAKEVGAYFMVDMAHFAGLVAAGLHPSPFEYADVVTTTTHKTLRGPRGGMILSNNEELGKKFNSAVFPGLQGGPLMHAIAGKAVAFQEALQPSYNLYIQRVVKNSQILAETLMQGGLNIITGGTDTHLSLVDLRPKGLTGNVAEATLEKVGLTCNKNSIPNDPEKPFITSGIRIGSPAGTTRGFGEQEFKLVGELMLKTLNNIGDSSVENEVLDQVRKLCQNFPIY